MHARTSVRVSLVWCMWCACLKTVVLWVLWVLVVAVAVAVVAGGGGGGGDDAIGRKCELLLLFALLFELFAGHGGGGGGGGSLPAKEAASAYPGLVRMAKVVFGLVLLRGAYEMKESLLYQPVELAGYELPATGSTPVVGPILVQLKMLVATGVTPHIVEWGWCITSN